MPYTDFSTLDIFVVVQRFLNMPKKKLAQFDGKPIERANYISQLNVLKEALKDYFKRLLRSIH